MKRIVVISLTLAFCLSISHAEAKITKKGIKGVYRMMTSGNYEKHMITPQKGTSCESPLVEFRMVSGKMQARNFCYTFERKYGHFYPKLRPALKREWVPVKLNGIFYEYTFSCYDDSKYFINTYGRGSTISYIVRKVHKVKGEIISVYPPRVKEAVKCFTTWGAQTKGPKRPWRRSDYPNNTVKCVDKHGRSTTRCISEWRRK